MSHDTTIRPDGRARHLACRRGDVPAGGRLLVTVNGLSIGLFDVDGKIHALHNRCPHMAGTLCAGRVTGTTLPVDGYEFVYGHEGTVLRCAWHGWEFDIRTGESTCGVKYRAKRFEVLVENNDIFVLI